MHFFSFPEILSDTQNVSPYFKKKDFRGLLYILNSKLWLWIKNPQWQKLRISLFPSGNSKQTSFRPHIPLLYLFFALSHMQCPFCSDGPTIFHLHCRSGLPWSQWLAGHKQPGQSAAGQQHQALDTPAWASVALPAGVPALGRARVSSMSGFSCSKELCQLHLSQRVTLLRATSPGDGKEGILPDA